MTQSLAEVRDRLQSVRETIVRAAPQARETISYRIFAFTQHGHALNFGAFKRPVGLCAGTAENTAFQAELVGYHRAMYSIRFPQVQPMSLPQIEKIVQSCVEGRGSP